MMRRLLKKWAGSRPSAAPEVVTPPAQDPAAGQHLEAARRHLAAGNLVQAEAAALLAVGLRHDFGAAHLLLGELRTKAGAVEDALDCYRLAAHFAPELVAAQLALATAALALQALDEAEAACRAALALDTGAVAAWFCLGNVLKARGELAAAAAAYRAAAAIAPEAADVLHQLAFVEFRLGEYAVAGISFDRLLAVAPGSPKAHHNRGLLQLETGYAEQALQSFRRALELQPATVETLTCIGHALRDLGRVDEAIATYDEALALRPGFGDAFGNRAQALLLCGNYAAGWPAYEQRFVTTGRRARSAGLPRWRGEPLGGRTLVVLSEQGIGDEIMFASCLPDLLATGGRVVLACDKRLQPLFARSFPQANVLDRDVCAATNLARPHGDCEISIGSLPLHFRRDRTRFPATPGYLAADAAAVARRRAAFGANGATRRIGVAWRGGLLRNRGYLRSLELAELAPLFEKSGTAFYSLQYGDRRDELAAIRESCRIEMPDLAPAAGADIDELAAAIAALDLVITVDNSVAHLSGALGKPTWILLPFSAEWRYGRPAGDDDAMPWYPSARLFRQSAPRDWTTLVAGVAQVLARGT
jgi:tetratricopeptide (TPR) repeat protein